MTFCDSFHIMYDVSRRTEIQTCKHTPVKSVQSRSLSDCKKKEELEG